jgi:GT2 family glycosyltransferase
MVRGEVGRIDEARVRNNAPSITNRIDRFGRVRTNLDGDSGRSIETLKGCNMSFRRTALMRAGRFDLAFEGTAFLEDADASTRVAAAGWLLWFEPAAAVSHLSIPAGGVRQGNPQDTSWWRFHNTGLFMRRHRGMLALPGVMALHAANACRRAVSWRQPQAVPQLLYALARGWTRGGHARP